MSGDDSMLPAGEERVEDAQAVATALPVEPPSVGQQLRAAREAKGMAVSEVASALKLSTHQVSALEADDWPSLPCKTIIRGFVRNYGRLLSLDTDPLMRALELLKMPPAPELEVMVGVPVTISQNASAGRRDYVWVISGVLILLVSLLATFVVPRDMWQSTLSALKAATQSNEMETEPATEPVTEPVTESENQAVALTTDSVVLPAGETALAENREAEAPATPITLVQSPSPSPVTPAMSLKFGFRQPAWVEVRDRSGAIIFSQLSPAGSQREITGLPPFVLVVGNAGQVTLEYKGAPVDLSKRSKEDVARLTLE